MEPTIKETPTKKRKSISREILNDLPEWFGMPKHGRVCCRFLDKLRFLACFIHDEVAGFIVLNATRRLWVYFFVMGITKNIIVGIGTKLNAAYEAMARKLGYTYSQVKTRQRWDSIKNTTNQPLLYRHGL